MKIRRYKKVHKNLSFYVNYFGFRQPYQVLLDGTFCYTALNNKINIRDNIPKYLQGETKFLTTQCAIIETESLGPKLSGTVIVQKQFSLHKCGHEGKPVTGAECILAMIGKQNASHYIIATQDRDLQSKVRLIAGTPLLYLHQKTPVLEQPSRISEERAKLISSGQLDVREIEKERLTELKGKLGLEENKDVPKKKKKKGGPNPLSCKKKKTKTTLNVQSKVINKDGGQKKRKKIRVPKHVKAELLGKKIS